MKTRKCTKGYFEFEAEDNSEKTVLLAAKKQGYKYMFYWINSDHAWYFFQTTGNKARGAAIELYMQEKNCTDKKIAERYFSECIDIHEIDSYLRDIE